MKTYTQNEAIRAIRKAREKTEDGALYRIGQLVGPSSEILHYIDYPGLGMITLEEGVDSATVMSLVRNLDKVEGLGCDSK